MQYLGGVMVIPSLPKELERLKDLAYNLYLSWNPDVRDLFIAIDRELWKKTNHNPVKFLNEVQQKKLKNVSSNKYFIEQ
jgi:starch phosphorylase